ncbi:MAG: D-tyrosyl-tRNA(Tyr) deacylase [Clostridia bacterium]|nr:D-tyrosyl-tRNA(Tyr) deacylase [Clostridia bacterium]
MKALIQRVLSASVSVENRTVGQSNAGYMILFCAVEGDNRSDIQLLARKTVNLRVFRDENDKMNKSITDVDGEVLCISQFTLAADAKKGNRPSFIKALAPDIACEFYDEYCKELENLGVKKVEKGVFGADMQVSLVNDGPVTILLDTEVWNKNGS